MGVFATVSISGVCFLVLKLSNARRALHSPVHLGPELPERFRYWDWRRYDRKQSGMPFESSIAKAHKHKGAWMGGGGSIKNGAQRMFSRNPDRTAKSGSIFTPSRPGRSRYQQPWPSSSASRWTCFHVICNVTRREVKQTVGEKITRSGVRQLTLHPKPCALARTCRRSWPCRRRRAWRGRCCPPIGPR